MTHPHDAPRSENPDVARAALEISNQLRARGVDVHDGDSPDELVRLLEAVEAFERAVVSHGGDLMVDEPPAHGRPQPDDPHFLLPRRGADESVAMYVDRLRAAMEQLRRHPRHPDRDDAR